jgi:SpoVK/Ycf46/Vps4 family AAA+-type ATPase
MAYHINENARWDGMSASHHSRKNPGGYDVITGKGLGLIVLLSGPPGTGKTLMAEAVAEECRLPLYYLQAEELGINGGTLGPNIKKIFEMATEWDAVILLDEADVFMAKRAPSDIQRNELVSIFLRELEYFKGISKSHPNITVIPLMLTTSLPHNQPLRSNRRSLSLARQHPPSFLPPLFHRPRSAAEQIPRSRRDNSY